MHNRCAQSYCQQHGLTLEQATPICKHWRYRGFCIYEASSQTPLLPPLFFRVTEISRIEGCLIVGYATSYLWASCGLACCTETESRRLLTAPLVQGTCFYKHPPEAKGTPKLPQVKPTTLELAARAAAWRALNQTAQKGVPHASNHPTSGGSSGVTSTNGNESLKAPPAQILTECKPAPDSLAAKSVGDQTGPQIAQACEQRAISGVRAFPSLAALHAASNAACAVQNRGPGKRNKVKNRFRAGVFRRCAYNLEQHLLPEIAQSYGTSFLISD